MMAALLTEKCRADQFDTAEREEERRRPVRWKR